MISITDLYKTLFGRKGIGEGNVTSERGAKITGGLLVTFDPKLIYVDGELCYQINNKHYTKI